MKKFILLYAIIQLIVFGKDISAATVTYNPTTSFSIDNGNPNGVWSYGWSQTDSSAFTLDDAAFKPGDALPQNDTWPMAIWGGWRTGEYPPHMWVNTTIHTISNVLPGLLTLHPGQSEQPSILRWTSPIQSTNCNISGEFLPGDIGSMLVGIRKGNEWIWNATDSGTFNLSMPINQGDTIDYMVSGGFSSGNTPLATTISCELGKLFDIFEPSLNLRLNPNLKDDIFALSGNLALNPLSDGINPINEVIVLQVGSYSVTVPAGSFKFRNGKFKFVGTISGVSLNMAITPIDTSHYSFSIMAKNANFQTMSLPIEVGLTIGDDSGLSTLNTDKISAKP